MIGQYGRITDKLTQCNAAWLSHEPIKIAFMTTDEIVEFRSLDELEEWLNEEGEALNDDPVSQNWLSFDYVWSGDFGDDQQDRIYRKAQLLGIGEDGVYINDNEFSLFVLDGELNEIEMPFDDLDTMERWLDDQFGKDGNTAHENIGRYLYEMTRGQ